MGDHIRIIFLSDTHGHMEPFLEWEGPAAGQVIGGAVGAGRLIADLRADAAARGWESLLLNGGDAWIDTEIQHQTSGQAMLDLLNEWHLDAFTLGNHDYGVGLDRLKELIHMARFPVMAVNLMAEDGPPAWQTEPVILIRGGLRIGIIGLTYHATMESVVSPAICGLVFSEPYAPLAECLQKVRGQADLVIVLSHCGTAVDRDLTKRFDAIDLLIGAHSHDLIPYERIKSVPYAQARGHGGYLGVVDLQRREGDWVITDARSLTVPAVPGRHTSADSPVIGESAEVIPPTTRKPLPSISGWQRSCAGRWTSTSASCRDSTSGCRCGLVR